MRSTRNQLSPTLVPWAVASAEGNVKHKIYNLFSGYLHLSA